MGKSGSASLAHEVFLNKGILLMGGGLDPWTTALVVLIVGCLWGLLNGVVVAHWRLPAFIATLATMSAGEGSSA